MALIFYVFVKIQVLLVRLISGKRVDYSYFHLSRIQALHVGFKLSEQGKKKTTEKLGNVREMFLFCKLGSKRHAMRFLLKPV